MGAHYTWMCTIILTVLVCVGSADNWWTSSSISSYCKDVGQALRLHICWRSFSSNGVANDVKVSSSCGSTWTADHKVVEVDPELELRSIKHLDEVAHKTWFWRLQTFFRVDLEKFHHNVFIIIVSTYYSLNFFFLQQTFIGKSHPISRRIPYYQRGSGAFSELSLSFFKLEPTVTNVKLCLALYYIRA